MESKQYFNYLTASNGSKVIECSSSYEKNVGSHVLIENPRVHLQTNKEYLAVRNWPSSIFEKKAKLYKCFGIDCWHDYESNPKTIELLVSLNGENYISWVKIKCELTAGSQFFDIDHISSSYSYLKIVVTETFGENKCYINRVFLLSENPEKIGSMDRSISHQMNDSKTIHNSSFQRGSHRSHKSGIPKMRKTYSGQDNFEEIEPLTNGKFLFDREDDRIVIMRFEKEFDILRSKQLEMENNILQVKGQNKLLVDRVVFLEEALEDKEDKIKELYKLINGMADQLGDIIRNEVAEGLEQSKTENQILENRIEDLESGLKQELEIRCDEIANFVKESQNRSLASNSKAESTFRTKQKHIMNLMQKLQEKLALRDMKVNQLRNEYDSD